MALPDSTESGEARSLTGTTIGRFAVQEKLGSGGMGEVYRADDTRLRRIVAIKRMSGALRTDSAHQRRFVREAERASQLIDPHIAALYDILEENGEIYLVMEFVQGTNFRDHFSSGTSLKEFAALAIQTAKGLNSAHAKGIVHCDIKPENIMVATSGTVKILDFGVARQFSNEGPPSALTKSTMGMSGTPAYMAPEVMLEESPEPRSDIFSLGVVFYEVLSGTHPFRKRTVFETADSVLHSSPAALTTFGVPKQLSDIVGRMMEKEPAKRFANTQDLISALEDFESSVTSDRVLVAPKKPEHTHGAARFPRRVWISGLLALALIGGGVGTYVFVHHRHASAHALGFSQAPQVAVLPFQSIGGQQSDQSFATGLSDVITSGLAQLSRGNALHVVPAMEVRSGKITSAQTARQLFGVDLVIEGSVQTVANMWRATYSIVDARTGRQLKGGTISVPTTDPFGLQDQLANSIVNAMGLEIPANERNNLAARGTTVSQAYDEYLQGLGYLQEYQKKESLDQAVAAFNRALDYDSSYALAYAGLGEAYWHMMQETKNRSALSDAELACQRALSLDSSLPEAHRCLGRVYVSSGKYTEAAQQLQTAVDQRPTDDASVRALASAYESLQDFRQAEATFQRAIQLRPNYWAGYNLLGAYYYGRGEYPKAIDMFKRVIALAPDNYRGYNNLGGIYILQGDFEHAIEQFERSVQLRPYSSSYSNLGTAYFFQRKYEQSAAAFKQAVSLNDRDYVVWGNLGDAQKYAPGQRNYAAASYRRAIALAEEAVKTNDKDAFALGSLAMYHVMLGEKQAAEGYLNRALALKPPGPDVWQQASVVYSQLGRANETLSAIQSALAAGLSSAYISSAPYYDFLHSDPRFQTLIASAQKLERH